jgi:hypothetical protein
MSIAELKELIADLPDDMTVVMPHGDETYITVCFEQSECVDFPVEDDTAEEGFSYVSTFVLRPCTCSAEDLPVVPAEQILN